MAIDRLHYELKLMGKRVILTPILIVGGAALFSFLLHYLHTDPARFLLAVPEMLLPIAAGVIVGTIVTQDPTLELQMTMPKKYHLTGMMRLLLILGWTACIALLAISSLNMLKLLYLPKFILSWSPLSQFFMIQAIWLAPLLWCVAVSFCFALLMQSRTASGALLGVIWLVEIIYKDFIALTPWLRPTLLFPTTLLMFPATDATQADFNTYWLTTRFELLATALVLLSLGWLLLRNTERMLKGATEE